MVPPLLRRGTLPHWAQLLACLLLGFLMRGWLLPLQPPAPPAAPHPAHQAQHPAESLARDSIGPDSRSIAALLAAALPGHAAAGSAGQPPSPAAPPAAAPAVDASSGGRLVPPVVPHGQPLFRYKQPKPAAPWQLTDVDAYIQRYMGHGASGKGSGGPNRVCLVTSAIAGPTPHGGVGTAFHALAMHMASRRDSFGEPLFKVTVVYAAHPWYGAGSSSHWIHHFRQFGIDFVPLDSVSNDRFGKTPEYYGPPLVVRAYRVFQYLMHREDDFDLISYPDYLANGYFVAMAKRQGIAFQHCVLHAQCHSTLRWADALNSRPPKDHNTLAYYYMEQKSVEWADVRVSPSFSYLQWYDSQEGGYDLRQGQTFVLPNLLYPLPAEAGPAKTGGQNAEAPAPVPAPFKRRSHFVFFSRLELRKGLLVFLDALDQLSPADRAQIHVSFVGPDVSVGGEKASEIIGSRLAASLRSSDRVTIRSDLVTDKALEYIRNVDGVVVLPTLGDNSPYVVLEIIAAGLPLITTTAGGGVELVRRGDQQQDRFLVPPRNATALAQAMVTAMREGISSWQPAVPFATVVDTYLNLLMAFRAQRREEAGHAKAAASASGNTAPPRVLIGITSHNRPDVLMRAVHSLLGQSFARSQLGVVIEDDASNHPDMPAVLESAQRLLQSGGLALAEVHRQSQHQFVAVTRNQILRTALEKGFDWACFMVRPQVEGRQ